MFRHRALTAAIGLPVLFGLLYLDGFPWAFGLPLLALVVAASMFGAEEFRQMLLKRGFQPPPDMGMMMGALPPLFLYFYHYDYNNIVLLLLTLGIVVDVLMIALALIGDIVRRMAPRPSPVAAGRAERKSEARTGDEPPAGGTLGALRDFVLMGIGGVYIGGLLSYLIFLRRFDDAIAPPWGVWPVLLLIAAIWIADTAAFTAGKLLDGPKLWPRVSPGKTIAGTVAGIAACAIVFAAVAAAGASGGPFRVAVVSAAIVGAIVGVAGLGGDLAESAIKRWAGVKDSGTIFPGHGGVLDRFDSLTWGAPALFYIMIAMHLA